VKDLGLNFQPIEEVIHETVTSFKELGWLAWLCSGWLIPNAEGQCHSFLEIICK
jgi:hypothetical protein